MPTLVGIGPSCHFSWFLGPRILTWIPTHYVLSFLPCFLPRQAGYHKTVVGTRCTLVWGTATLALGGSAQSGFLLAILPRIPIYLT